MIEWGRYGDVTAAHRQPATHIFYQTRLAQCGELELLFAKVYEDNASGKLSDERFMMMSGLALKKKISALQAEIGAGKRHKHG
ncbi:MAG TPA: hypothetical protein DEP42_03165 [Ruminococcaceae bacterium]|nr:hypothetical protein [Oscillospiraceae bacterium]